MSLLKLQSSDGFVLRDFDDAPSAGLVRRARKILRSSAGDLARSATYSFAAFEIPMSGASAGINLAGSSEEESVAAGIASATAELADLGRQYQITLHPGKGVTRELLGPSPAGYVLGGPNPNPEHALAVGVVASTKWALGGDLTGRRVAIEGGPGSPAPRQLASVLIESGAELVTVDGADEQPWKVWAADVDVILAGSKLGVLDHKGAELLRAEAVVPWGPLPYTTRALAVANRLGHTRVLPGFVTAAGPLLAAHLPGTNGPEEALSALADRIPTFLTSVADHHDGTVLGACHRAESFLTTWRPRLPFGRPMAP